MTTTQQQQQQRAGLPLSSVHLAALKAGPLIIFSRRSHLLHNFHWDTENVLPSCAGLQDCRSKVKSSFHKEAFRFSFLSKYNLDLLSFYGSLTYGGKTYGKKKTLSNKVYSTRVEVKHIGVESKEFIQ